MYNWYDKLNKAPWTPPNWVFGIIWPILYFLMTISAGLVLYEKDNNYLTIATTLFCIQLILNLSWAPVFFNLEMPNLAFAIMTLLIVSTIATIYYFSKISKLSATLLFPYIIWLFIAFSLNLYIVIYN